MLENNYFYQFLGWEPNPHPRLEGNHTRTAHRVPFELQPLRQEPHRPLGAWRVQVVLGVHRILNRQGQTRRVRLPTHFGGCRPQQHRLRPLRRLPRLHDTREHRHRHCRAGHRFIQNFGFRQGEIFECFHLIHFLNIFCYFFSHTFFPMSFVASCHQTRPNTVSKECHHTKDREHRQAPSTTCPSVRLSTANLICKFF